MTCHLTKRVSVILRYCLAAILAYSLLSIAPIANGDERVPTLYYPTFETSEGIVEAGTAFIVMQSEKYYAVSAQHLIGIAGGLKSA